MPGTRHLNTFSSTVVIFLIVDALMRRSAAGVVLRGCGIRRPHPNYAQPESRDIRTTGNSIPYKNILVLDVDNVQRNVSYIDIGEDTSLPPLVIIPGTAQTAATFSPHYRQITKTRRLIIPEIRSQGRTELLSEYCTIDQHVGDFYSIIVDHMGINRVHLAGFSFGGRVSLAIAAHYPQHVERLSITGVPYERSALGSLILQSWREGLLEGHLRNCAWSFILNGYSADFIDRNRDKLANYVDMVVGANDVKKLADLLVYGHVTRREDLYSVPACAAKVSMPTQIIGALQDRIAGIEAVRELHQNIPGSTFHEMNTGHLAPFENTSEWRALLLDFMAA